MDKIDWCARRTLADRSYEAVCPIKTIKRYLDTKLMKARGPRSHPTVRAEARLLHDRNCTGIEIKHLRLLTP
jgi:hypothetical protein